MIDTVHHRLVDDQRVGLTLRSIRTRKRWRQADLAEKAGVSRWVVMRIERGRVAGVPVDKVRRVAAALDAQIDMHVRWRGGDLARLINSRHAAMHEAMARFFDRQSPWLAEPEVSFSIWGERGTIDILAWHPLARAVLIVELKSELVDINDLLGTLDRKRRLATQVAETRGFHPALIGTWLVVADSRTNRNAVAAHRAAIRNKLPTDGRGIGRWLDRPDGHLAALSFLPRVQGMHLAGQTAPIKRVNQPRTRLTAPRTSVG
jgi:transcriptional regulator with XRE-family HTH domain